MGRGREESIECLSYISHVMSLQRVVYNVTSCLVDVTKPRNLFFLQIVKSGGIFYDDSTLTLVLYCILLAFSLECGKLVCLHLKPCLQLESSAVIYNWSMFEFLACDLLKVSYTEDIVRLILSSLPHYIIIISYVS